MERIIGIDLGTTNSLVSVWQDGRSRLIPNSLGEYLTPSIVSIDEEGHVYVGKIAKERLTSHPEHTAALFKRFMGTEKTYALGGREYRPEELSALVLRRLKEDAERYLGTEIKEAVISVPAYFNDMARKATKDAGALAGLHVERIVNEPSAAALACRSTGGKGQAEEDETLLVFDFGGGTLDVSLVDCFDNVVEIVSVSGDNRLGGSDFDRAVAEQFCKEHGLCFDALSPQRQNVILRRAAQAKCMLSETEQTVMTVTDGEFQGQMELTNQKLIQISMPLFHRMLVPVRAVLNDGQKERLEISKVVLAGGSCKMPTIQQYLRHFLPYGQMTVMDPDHMIAAGVGVHAGIKERKEEVKDLLLTDICPFTLGTGVYNEADARRSIMAPIIDRNSVLPCRKEQRFQTAKDFQKSVKIDVYQGEAYYVDENIYLGELSVDVPMALKGQESITVCYTYDINGILVVDVKVDSTGKQARQVITTGTYTLDPAELEQYLRDLEQLHSLPADEEDNQMLIAWGERLFAQTTGELREEIGRRIQYFQHLVNQEQDPYKIRKQRKYIADFFERADRYLDTFADAWQRLEDDSSWYEPDSGGADPYGEGTESMAEEEDLKWYDGHLTS